MAIAYPAGDEAEARSTLESRARERFDATHHCAAWRFRDGSWRVLDAGEPSGSAGAPILAAIDARDLLDVAVIVTRYFGGTKLGVGGLVRAYGEAAGAALAAAPRRQAIPAARLAIRFPYAATSVVMRSIDRFQLFDLRHDFTPTGDAAIEFALPLSSRGQLEEVLREQSAGSIELEGMGETIVYLPVT